MKNYLVWLCSQAVSFDKSEVPPDCLSSCHLLVDILRFLDYSDVLNCRLVNHHINHVIQKNQHSMPRRKADLHICDISYDEPHIILMLTTNVKHFYLISDRHITIWNFRNSGILKVDAHFAQYAVPAEMDEIPADKIAKMKKTIDICGGEWDVVKCYRTFSIEEGLRTVVRILFRLFYFNEMSFSFPKSSEDLDKELLNMVVEEFRGSRSVCSRILQTSVSPGILDLPDALGCRNLWLYLQNLNIRDILPIIPLNEIEELILSCEIDTFDEIVELIRDMHSPSLRLSHIELWNTSIFNVDYHDSFVATIKSNFDISVVSKSPLFRFFTTAKPSVEIIRSTDSKAIKIYCSGWELHMPTEKAS